MASSDLLLEVTIFLAQILAQEKLSSVAEDKRIALLRRLPTPAKSPPVPPLLGTNRQPQPLPANEPECDYEVSEPYPEDVEYEEFPTNIEDDDPKTQQAPMVPIPKPLSNSSTSEVDVSIDTNSIPALPAETMLPEFLMGVSSKHGPLYRKERFLFGKQLKRGWAAVNTHYMFFFGNEKDSKPLVTIWLQGYQARPAPYFVKDPKKKDFCFEIVAPGKKTHQYMARTQKDMQQWVVAINDESDKVPSATPVNMLDQQPSVDVTRRRRLPSLPISDTDEPVHHEDVEEDSSSSNYEMMHSDEEIYYKIDATNESEGVDGRDLHHENHVSAPLPPSRPSNKDNSKVQQHYEDELPEYDDIDFVVTERGIGDPYYNCDVSPLSNITSVGCRTLPNPPAPAMATAVEDFYDDIGCGESPAAPPITAKSLLSLALKKNPEPPKTPKPPPQCKKPAFSPQKELTKETIFAIKLKPTNRSTETTTVSQVTTPQEPEDLYDDVGGGAAEKPSALVSSIKTFKAKEDQADISPQPIPSFLAKQKSFSRVGEPPPTPSQGSKPKQALSGKLAANNTSKPVFSKTPASVVSKNEVNTSALVRHSSESKTSVPSKNAQGNNKTLLPSASQHLPDSKPSPVFARNSSDSKLDTAGGFKNSLEKKSVPPLLLPKKPLESKNTPATFKNALENKTNTTDAPKSPAGTNNTPPPPPSRNFLEIKADTQKNFDEKRNTPPNFKTSISSNKKSSGAFKTTASPSLKPAIGTGSSLNKVGGPSAPGRPSNVLGKANSGNIKNLIKQMEGTGLFK